MTSSGSIINMILDVVIYSGVGLAVMYVFYTLVQILRRLVKIMDLYIIKATKEIEKISDE